MIELDARFIMSITMSSTKTLNELLETYAKEEPSEQVANQIVFIKHTLAERLLTSVIKGESSDTT